MAGLATYCCSSTTLSSESFRGTPLKLKSLMKPALRRGLAVRAEVKFVNADQAKELVEADGYAILDVRDKSQFERAHIKSCNHVPLFIENQDNDIGTILKRSVHNNFSGFNDLVVFFL